MTEETQSQTTGTNVEQEENQELNGAPQAENSGGEEQTEEQQSSKKSKGVEKLLSERNQLKQEKEQLEQELERLKGEEGDTNSQEYVEKLTEKKMKEMEEKQQREREKQDYINRYGQESMQTVEEYLKIYPNMAYEDAHKLAVADNKITQQEDNSLSMPGQTPSSVTQGSNKEMSPEELKQKAREEMRQKYGF